MPSLGPMILAQVEIWTRLPQVNEFDQKIQTSLGEPLAKVRTT
ncbi:hypothetical protein GcC1_194026 [Golovinomyces cichoracearum]|uniref:Uncharacterized protein n=1 Tax=Golovinomyces cichoracearum TaxID=62708 RepID=A0A420HH55_9PEZI|nr:hypothetical protein GcC1_194026 [Golovinomyces cichoracearum]